MAKTGIKRKIYKNAPGVIVQCKSGRYLAFFEHRTDIVASGDSVLEAKKNLKQMYKVVMKHERDEEANDGIVLPKDFKTSKFVEKIPLK